MNPTLKQVREALALALSFAPKGPVPEGLFPTAYHTLDYGQEVKLQGRVDAAREVLAALDQMPKLPSRQEFFEVVNNGVVMLSADEMYDYLTSYLGEKGAP